MLNLYETIRSTLNCNKFEVEGLMFVEYKCPVEDESMALWSPVDYLVHVLSGQKTWRTPAGSWKVSAGQTLFIKKGAAIIDQFFDDDFCMLGFFMSDEFIKNTVKEFSDRIEMQSGDNRSEKLAIEIKNDAILSAYFQSMTSYFGGPEKPSDALLILKMRELIINILSNSNNREMALYFKSLPGSGETKIRQIMDANFCYNLSLENFAELCNRSLSSFKRDFKKYFGESPGKWLRNRRLDYAAILIQNSALSISQIVFESGFEELSHFSRVFKNKFGISPNHFRQRLTA